MITSKQAFYTLDETFRRKSLIHPSLGPCWRQADVLDVLDHCLSKNLLVESAEVFLIQEKPLDPEYIPFSPHFSPFYGSAEKGGEEHQEIFIEQSYVYSLIPNKNGELILYVVDLEDEGVDLNNGSWTDLCLSSSDVMKTKVKDSHEAFFDDIENHLLDDFYWTFLLVCKKEWENPDDQN